MSPLDCRLHGLTNMSPVVQMAGSVLPYRSFRRVFGPIVSDFGLSHGGRATGGHDGRHLLVRGCD